MRRSLRGRGVGRGLSESGGCETIEGAISTRGTIEHPHLQLLNQLTSDKEKARCLTKSL